MSLPEGLLDFGPSPALLVAHVPQRAHIAPRALALDQTPAANVKLCWVHHTSALDRADDAQDAQADIVINAEFFDALHQVIA